MPNLVAHYVFGEYILKKLSDNIRSIIERHVYDFALAGPDIWFCGGYYEKKSKLLSQRCDYMHKNKTGQFLMELLETTLFSENKELLFSYLTGYLCHYCLDRTCHPYILYCTGNQHDHVRLEIAIDSLFIRKRYNCLPWRFQFNKGILLLDKLPECISEEIDSIYYNTYEWNDAFKDINRCIKGQKRFYSLVQDPFGIFTKVFKIRSAITGREFPIQTYFHKDLPPSIDYMNKRHQRWRNPFDPDIISMESFKELYDRAACDCIKMIKECYYCAFCGKQINALDVLGNSSYYSGLPWNDSRNSNSMVSKNIFK